LLARVVTYLLTFRYILASQGTLSLATAWLDSWHSLKCCIPLTRGMIDFAEEYKVTQQATVTR